VITLTVTDLALRAVQVRVIPGVRGKWRVADSHGNQVTYATLPEATAFAERLLNEVGSGELLIYDASMRLHTVKRLNRNCGPRP
jgi:hypothetical protein